MRRKLIAPLLALTGVLIGLGAFGHSFVGRKSLDAGLAQVTLDSHTAKLIYLVWYFCGGCMLVFGLIVIWSGVNAWRGARNLLSSATLIGVFYLATGILALAYMKEPFWSVFVVLGGLTLLFSLLPKKI